MAVALTVLSFLSYSNVKPPILQGPGWMHSPPPEVSSPNDKMSSVARQKHPFPQWIILLVFSLSLGILSILNCELSIHDTARVAGIAREMAFTGNYFIPKLNGQNFLEYPSLGYLPVSLFLSTSGTLPDFLAILPIALMGTATVLLTFRIGKMLADERAGLIAGFFLATMSGFFTLHRRCLVDPTLLFFTVLSLYGFAAGHQARSKRFRFYVIFYLAMAGGFLSKGLIGVAIPAGTALVFLALRKDFAGIRRLYLGWGILLFFIPIVLWMMGVWWLEGSHLIKEVVRQSVWRFLSPSADHSQPVYFYFIPVLLNTLPWTPLPLVWLWYRRSHHEIKSALRPEILPLFAAVWFLTVFIGLSLASAKRSLYGAPLYPPFALLAAFAWSRLRYKIPNIKRIEIYAMIVLFVAYLGIHFAILLPSENKDSFRPVFEIIQKQQSHGPVYLCGGSESLQGAAVFYLGNIVPVRSKTDLMQEKLETASGTVLIIPSLPGDEQLLAHIRAKGFRLLTEKRVRKMSLQVYTNSILTPPSPLLN